MCGVDHTGHQDGEDDVAVEVASLRNGAGDNRGAGGSKCTLNKTQKLMDLIQIVQIFISLEILKKFLPGNT